MLIIRSFLFCSSLTLSLMTFALPPLANRMNQLNFVMSSLQDVVSKIVANAEQVPQVAKECSQKQMTESQVVACARLFLDLRFSTKSLLSRIPEVNQLRYGLHNDFAATKAKISDLIGDAETLGRKVEQLTKDASEAFLKVNKQILMAKLDDSRRGGRDRGMIQIICTTFENKIDGVKTAIDFGEAIDASFSYFYKQRSQLIGLAIVGQEIQRDCSGSLNLGKIDSLINYLNRHVTVGRFEKFRNQICSRSAAQSRAPNCKSLPYNSFTVEWLERVSGGAQ